MKLLALEIAYTYAAQHVLQFVGIFRRYKSFTKSEITALMKKIMKFTKIHFLQKLLRTGKK